MRENVFDFGFLRPDANYRKRMVPNILYSHYGDGSLNEVSDGYFGKLYDAKTNDFFLEHYSSFVRGNIFIKNRTTSVVSQAKSYKRAQTPNNTAANPQRVKVLNGWNTMHLDHIVQSDKFCSLLMTGGSYTATFYIKSLELIFLNGVKKTLKQSVLDGYIQPLVPITSYVQENTSYQFLQPLNIYDGGQTDTRNYSNLHIGFVTIQPLVGYYFYTNKDWSTSYPDGVMLTYCDAKEGMKILR